LLLCCLSCRNPHQAPLGQGADGLARSVDAWPTGIRWGT
jgi:hypothetical protein